MNLWLKLFVVGSLLTFCLGFTILGAVILAVQRENLSQLLLTSLPARASPIEGLSPQSQETSQTAQSLLEPSPVQEIDMSFGVCIKFG